MARFVYYELATSWPRVYVGGTVTMRMRIMLLVNNVPVSQM
jgi:hypothetical protein